MISPIISVIANDRHLHLLASAGERVTQSPYFKEEIASSPIGSSQ
jgi:hypothetical protein